MKLELKEILDGIIKDLREQGHDPLERPIVFVWSYPEGEFKFTLVIQKKEDEDFLKEGGDEDGEVVH